MTAERGVSTASVLGIAAAVGLVPLNSTMIAVALPEIAADFEISTGRSAILITVYLVAMLIGQPLAGRIGDALGARRTVRFALLGMIVGSVAAAASPTFIMLVVARTAQAAFAAALSPSVQSLLRAATPPAERGRSFGLMGSVLGVGAASGPVIGGLLTQAFGWQAIFLFNVPVAAAAYVVTMRVDPAPAAERVEAATRATRSDGASDDGSDGVNGRIVNAVFVSAFSVQALTTLAQYALLLLTPIILDARGWESGSIGVLLSALTIGMIVTGPIGGRLGDRFGRRTPTQVGLAVATAATAALLIGGATSGAVLLVAGLAVFGLGLGTAMPNMMTAALESVAARRTGSAAGVLSMSRYVGSIATSVVVSAVVTSDAGGTRTVLTLAFVAMIVAALPATRFPGPVTR